MGQDTDELTTTPADIEATRADLSRNLDELSDKVSPQRVVARRKEAARSSLASVREKLMGSADSTSSTGLRGNGASGAASSAKDSAQSAVDSLQSATAGSPLTAGLVAFGAGMLISALLPASAKEAEAARRVVETAKEHGQPLLDEAKSVGQDMGKDLGDAAAAAAQEVKSTAQDSVANVKDEGQSSADRVKDEAPGSS
jgi:gas vesicle protein